MEPPSKIGQAYKAFIAKNGKLYPPQAPNPNNSDTPIGEWLEAHDNPISSYTKTGRPHIKGIHGTLAYRPGWHLGELPIAPQFHSKPNAKTGYAGGEYPSDLVWALVDYDATKSYQDEAESYGRTENGGYVNSLAGLPYLPVGGYYKYRTNPDPKTNPWIITGGMRVNRLLGDDEVAEILRQHGIEPPNRRGGNKTLAELGLDVNDLFGRKIK